MLHRIATQKWQQNIFLWTIFILSGLDMSQQQQPPDGQAQVGFAPREDRYSEDDAPSSPLNNEPEDLFPPSESTSLLGSDSDSSHEPQDKKNLVLIVFYLLGRNNAKKSLYRI